MLKRFSRINDITDGTLRDKYQEFEQLNNLIESQKITRQEVEQAYSDIMLGEITIEQYTELHYQIKYLLDEIWVACNQILWFYDHKLPGYKQASIDLINSMYHMPSDIRKKLFWTLEWNGNLQYIELWIAIDWERNPRKIYINIDNDSEEDVYNKLSEWDKQMKDLSTKWVKFSPGVYL